MSSDGCKKINAMQFLNEFQNQWIALKSQVGEKAIAGAYGNDVTWTKSMQGYSSDKYRPEAGLLGPQGLLGKIGLALGFDPYQIRREDNKIDCSFFSGVGLLPRRNSEWGYASFLSVLIEHENNLESIDLEMWKLLFWRAPLKVIVSYDCPEYKRTSDAQKVRLKEKLDELKGMRDRVNLTYPEPEGTEYLIIIGNLAESNSIQWRWTINFGDLEAL